MTNERMVAMRTSAGSKSLSRRVWRRCNLKAWTSAADRSGTVLVSNGVINTHMLASD